MAIATGAATAVDRLEARFAGLSDLVPALGPAGRAVYDLAVNADLLRFHELYAAFTAPETCP